MTIYKSSVNLVKRYESSVNLVTREKKKIIIKIL